MADLETIHKIVEKLEVQGGQAAENAFAKLGGIAGMAAKALGLTKSKTDQQATAGGKLGDSLTDLEGQWKKTGDAAGGAGSKGAGGMNKMTAAVAKGHIIAMLLEKAIGFLWAKFKQMLAEGWALNLMYEDMQDKLTGLTLSTVEWGKQKDPAVQFARSAKAAGAMLSEFRDIAMKTADPIEKISGLSNRIQLLWGAAGRSMRDVVKATDAAASAAKVMGVDLGTVDNTLHRLVTTGKGGRNDPFGLAIAARAGIKKTDDLNTRINKIQKALEEIGKPVGEITKGTGDALQRWSTLSRDVIQRITKPAFDKVGEVVQWIVDRLEESKPAIDDIVKSVQDWFGETWSLAEGMWAIGKGLWKAVGAGDALKLRFGAVKDIVDIIFKLVGLIGHGWKVIGAGIEALVDPGAGMHKFKVLLEGLWVKFLKLIEAVGRLAAKLADMVVPDAVAKYVPGVEKLQGWAKDVAKSFTDYTSKKERDVAMWEDLYGMDPSTDFGRQLLRERQGIGMSKKDRDDLLGSLFGTKRPLLQIDKVEIHQDFRDQDPDRVMVEFVRDLEKLGENALQSAVGGAATVYGPGGTY